MNFPPPSWRGEIPTRHCAVNAINSTFLPHSMNSRTVSLSLLGKPNQLKVFSNFFSVPIRDRVVGGGLPFLSSQNRKFVRSAVIDKLLTCAAHHSWSSWEKPTRAILGPNFHFFLRAKETLELGIEKTPPWRESEKESDSRPSCVRQSLFHLSKSPCQFALTALKVSCNGLN